MADDYLTGFNNDDPSTANSCFSDWGSIISNVHDQLPTIDSDSESSTVEDTFVPNEIPVFQRNIQKETTESECDKLSLDSHSPASSARTWPDDNIEENHPKTVSEGYVSGSSSSSTSTGCNTAADGIPPQISTTSPNDNMHSSTLLFQRLLHSSALSGTNKDDLHLSDMDLDLPIYEIEDSVSSNSNKSGNSPLPLDYRNATLISDDSKTTTPDADNNLIEQDIQPAPVLSLGALEGFDFEDILDNSAVDKTEFWNSSSDEMSVNEDKVEVLMAHLRELSSTQLGDCSNSKHKSTKSDEPKANYSQHFLEHVRLDEEPGGVDKEYTELMEKDIVKKSKTASTSVSCGVSANFSLISQGLSMSEPTTVYIDLRPTHLDKENKAVEIKPIKEVSHFKVTRFDEAATATLTKNQNHRVQHLSKIKQPRAQCVGPVSSESEDDDDYEEWRRLRNRIKSRSNATAKITATRTKTLGGDALNKVDATVSSGDNKHALQFNDDHDSGKYESTRLKKETANKTGNTNNEKVSSKSKVTVTFAEEPKKSVDDNNNIYRSKTVNVVEPVVQIQTSSNSSQTDPPSRSFIDIVNDRLSVTMDGQFSDISGDDSAPPLIPTIPKVTTASSVTANLPNTPAETQKSVNVSEQLWLRKHSNYMDILATLKTNPTSHENKFKMEKKLIEIEKSHFNTKQQPSMLFDIDSSFDSPISVHPPTLDVNNTSHLVLLTINLSSPGCVVTHRAGVGYRQTPVDLPVGFSITFSMILSWLLALVPEDIKRIHSARLDGTFNLDTETYSSLLDPELSELNSEVPPEALAIEVPFNVVSLQQIWQEDIHSLSLQALVVPNAHYAYDSKTRGRKKTKKEDAFMQVVWQFLQSNKLQDVCPWYNRQSSPIYYTIAGSSKTCAQKPLSCFISTSNDPLLLKKALDVKPGFFWKTLVTDEQSCSNISSECNKPEVTTCLLQHDALLYPIAVMDVILRMQLLCCDIVGIKLAYARRSFLNSNTLYQDNYDSSDLKEILPCVVFAIRGRSAITKWSKVVGPRDPSLARCTDKESLNAQYGPQLCEMRKRPIPLDLNMFCYPRSETRSQQQLCIWFGGRVDFDDTTFSNIINPPTETKKTKNDKRSKNVKGKGKNKKDKKSSTEVATRNILSMPSMLVSCPVTRLYLVISPRFPIRYLGDVLDTVTRNGFLIEGIRRIRLNERKAATLSIPQRLNTYYCPPAKNDFTVEAEYYEMDNWWLRPSTVLLLAKENAQLHIASLIYALQIELLYGTQTPTEEVRECFHLCSFTEAIQHSIGSLSKLPDVELMTGGSPRSFFSDPELEQVVVLTLVGSRAVDEVGRTLQRLLHGEFTSTSAGHPLTIEDDLELNELPEEFRGFELLGIKGLTSLNTLQAKELTPFEVGTKRWQDSIPMLKTSPILICVLRRINAFQVLEEALAISNISSYSKDDLKLKDIRLIMSLTPEIAYRQMRMFFTDKELFADNQCRPLLKYLPSPSRVYQFKLHRNNVSLTNGHEEGGCGDSELSATSVASPSASKSKKKKKNGKNKDNNNLNNTQSLSFSQEESIIASVVAERDPLTSVLVIKPDAFPRHLIKILRNLNQEGFHIVAAKLLRMNEDQAMQLLPTQFKDMHGESQVFLDHMTSGPSVVLCVLRNNAIRRLSELAGPYDPVQARRKQQLTNGGSLYSLQCSMWNNGQGYWRAVYGIDNISNGIHVSESYNAAMAELKRFFPEGLCCSETLELEMELVPTPADDPVMCQDKMKGREIHYMNDNALSISNYLLPSLPRQPIVLILSTRLFTHYSVKRTLRKSNHKNNILPPYLLILDQLITQGFEICALRMLWFSEQQATQATELIGSLNNDGEEVKRDKIESLCNGSSMVLLLQRENALVLFDSILGSTQARGDSLYHKYCHDILRSQTPKQTENAAKYLFNRIPNPRSVMQIGHKLAVEWRDRNDVVEAMRSLQGQQK